MKFTKQDLLTLLIGLFLFASCKNPDGVGLTVEPGDQIQGTLVDNEEVTSQTVKEQDIVTAGSNVLRYPIGYMVDPIFGKTEASLGMTVVPSELNLDFGKDPQLDSAVLVLNLSSQFYGDTINSKYSIDVYQLTNKITKFKSNDVQDHESTLLGNFNGRILPNTPLKVYNVKDRKIDTVKAQIRIPLNKAFFQQNIINLAPAATSSNTKFIETFKGLYAGINKSSSNVSGGGGIAFIDFLTAGSSYLQLVYKNTNESGTIDTVSAAFPISNSNVVTTNIKHDYSGTPVQAQLDAPATSKPSLSYVQGLVGVKTKISFPTLTNFKAKYGNVVVNKAELVVDLGSNSGAYPFLPGQRLSLYRWDIAGQPVNVPDHDQAFSGYAGDHRALSDGVFGGYYDSLKNRYIFIVTSYVQDLIDNKKIDYGTFIGATSSTEFQLTPSATSATRTVIGTNYNTTNKLKLNIYYTKIN